MQALFDWFIASQLLVLLAPVAFPAVAVFVVGVGIVFGYTRAKRRLSVTIALVGSTVFSLIGVTTFHELMADAAE